MNETTIPATPASRREGTVMRTKRNTRRFVAAAITVAGLTGGVMAVHADTFSQRAVASQDLSQVPPPVWPAIAQTTCPGGGDGLTIDTACAISLDAGTDTVAVKDATVLTATVVGGVPTVTLGSTDYLSVGNTIVLSSTDAAWNNSFTVLTVSPDGRTVTLDAVSNPPTATATALPVIVQSVPILGFNVNNQSGGAHTLAGGATSTIKVPVGTWLTFTLTHSSIPGTIDLSFPSLPAADVSHVGDTYTVHATTLGTSVFQPGSFSATTGSMAPRQVAMGLVGTLIVTPAGCSTCAYDTTQYQDEALVATTDLDPEFANNPATFDMSYFGQSRDANQIPRKVYHVINGKSFPDTDVIDARAGDTVLLRNVNAGVTDKSIGILGLHETLLARNASLYKDPQTFIAPLVGPGETADLTVKITGAAGQRYSLMDQGRQENHGTPSGFGGALTFLNVWAGIAVDPTVDQLSFNVTNNTLTATGHPSAAGFTITGYQTVVNSGAAPDWTLATTQPLSGSIGQSAPFTTAALSAAAGQTVWVRVQQDGTGTNWSAASSTVVPTTVVTVNSATMAGTLLTATASALPPGAMVDGLYYSRDIAWATTTRFFTGLANPETATATVPGTLVDGDIVYVRATSPSAVGFSNVAQATVVGPKVNTTTFTAPDQLAIGASSPDANVSAAEYSIGTSAAAPGAGTALAGTFGSPTYSYTATISPPLVNGDTVWVRVKGSNGIWSQAKSVTADLVGPTISPDPTLSSPTDGTVDVALSASVSDVATGNSNIAAAEYFIDVVGTPANGTGSPMTGAFNAPTDSVTATLLAADVGALPGGSHVISVHAKDAAGNWGPMATVTLTRI